MVIAGLILLGLCFGSFVNALVWRLHKQEQTNQKTENKKQAGVLNSKLQTPNSIEKYSILYGRSMCPECKHSLSAKDLIPVFSWLALGGKCRYCKKPISFQYPLIEVLVAVLFVSSYLFWPEQLDFAGSTELAIWLASLVGLAALAVYDLRWMLLPNVIILPLLGLAVLNVLIQFLLTSDYYLLATSLWGAIIGGGLFYLLFQVSNGKWIGGGDVKLGFLLGAIGGGPVQALLMLFTASLLGTVVSLPLLAANKVSRNTRIPFGPFLILAAIGVRLFGEQLVSWYELAFIN